MTFHRGWSIYEGNSLVTWLKGSRKVGMTSARATWFPPAPSRYKIRSSDPWLSIQSVAGNTGTLRAHNAVQALLASPAISPSLRPHHALTNLDSTSLYCEKIKCSLAFIIWGENISLWLKPLTFLHSPSWLRLLGFFSQPKIKSGKEIFH